MRCVGVTMLVRVSDIKAATEFYSAVLGRNPDFSPSPDIQEWELLPDVWLLVAEAPGAPPQNGRIRFGVADVEAERRRLIEALALDVSPVERIEGVVAYCNFDDPWGNKMGLFQDLSKY